jgi:protein-disulfide isomerase
MKTETKVTIGILAATAIIIFGGITLFKGSIVPEGPKDYSQYVNTGLDLDKTKVSRDYNPKIVGSEISTSTASTTPIQITEFLDYECPACATNGETLVKALLLKYGSNIVVTRKIFPVHGQASVDIARVVLASQILGSEVYQSIHSKVFETQREWAILGKKDREDYIKKIIVDMGFDYDKIFAESQDQKYVDQIMQDKQDATDLGIKATPSFIIGNHTRITGGLPLDEIVKYIDMK